MSSVLDIRENGMPSDFICPKGLNIQQQQTQQVEGTGVRQIEPLGLWLKALNLPYGTISPKDGLWSEIQSTEGACGSLIILTDASNSRYICPNDNKKKTSYQPLGTLLCE